MRPKQNNLSLFLTTVFLILASSSGYAQQVGFESEFATVGFMETQWGEKQLLVSEKMLEIVKNSFAGKGEIVTVPWLKYPEKKLKIKSYIDPRGRTWSVDPESVNTTGLDGLEFVTPALDSLEDIERYSKIMQEFRKSKLLMRGLRSSNHITVDISHLTKNPNDISKLVDLILTIENHWAEIYRFFDPVRYGTVINRFSVPLALDQQDLLKELAALPKNKRSFKNVREIFLKYDSKESQLRDADGSNSARKWKYRAANYGKFFGLAPGSKSISAIEFRIGDLDFGSRIGEKAAFMQKLVNSKVLDKEFLFPFGDKALDWKQGTNVLQGLPLRFDFLKGLVGEKTFGTIQKKIQIAPHSEGAVDLLDMNRPVEKNGKFISFGFEAEFKNGARARSVINPDQTSPLLDKFPYLDSYVSEESSGNIEVRSVGGERVLAEVLEQMQEVRSSLREDMRGFHMHMRIPKEMIEKHDAKSLEAWMSSISDAVFSWRLQNKQHFFALKTETLARQGFTQVTERGPVRLTKMHDGTWDFEIRGYMSNLEMIGMMAQKVMTGIMSPQLIVDQVEEQMMLGRNKYSLKDGLRKFAKLYNQSAPTAKEEAIMDFLNREVKGLGLLPLYDFAQLFDSNPTVKRKIQDATWMFFKETSTVIRNEMAGKYSSPEELSKQFRWRVKRWAQLIDLQSLLEQRILTAPKFDKNGNLITASAWTDRQQRLKTNYLKVVDSDLSSENITTRRNAVFDLSGRSDSESLALIEKALNDVDARIRMHAATALKARVDDHSLTLVEKALNDADPIVRREAASSLRGKVGGKSLYLIEKALNDVDSYVQQNAASALKGRTDAGSLALVGKAFNQVDLYVRRNASLALVDQRGPESLPLIEIALRSMDTMIRMNGTLGLMGRTDAKSLELIKMAINSSDPDVRMNATAALQGRKDAVSLALIEKSFADMDAYVRKSAALALKGRAGNKSYELLKKAYVDADSEVREAAILALQGRADAKSYSLIKKALSDIEPTVRMSAVSALSGFTDKQFLEAYAVAVKAFDPTGEDLTSFKRIYMERFGSLKKVSTTAPICHSLFL